MDTRGEETQDMGNTGLTHIDIVCILSHFICFYYRTLDDYLIKKIKITLGKSAALLLGELACITRTGRVAFNSSGGLKQLI